MNKKVTRAFGSIMYLLGKDKDGVYYWLDEPDWYFDRCTAFGYIKTFSNSKNPRRSINIYPYQYAENFYPNWFGSDDPILVEHTFSEEEGWELAELFAQFYLLRQTAEYFDKGKCNIAATNIAKWKSPELVYQINYTRIPLIINRIIEILAPNKKK